MSSKPSTANVSNLLTPFQTFNPITSSILYNSSQFTKSTYKNNKNIPQSNKTNKNKSKSVSGNKIKSNGIDKNKNISYGMNMSLREASYSMDKNNSSLYGLKIVNKKKSQKTNEKQSKSSINKKNEINQKFLKQKSNNNPLISQIKTARNSSKNLKQYQSTQFKQATQRKKQISTNDQQSKNHTVTRQIVINQQQRQRMNRTSAFTPNSTIVLTNEGNRIQKLKRYLQQDTQKQLKSKSISNNHIISQFTSSQQNLKYHIAQSNQKFQQIVSKHKNQLEQTHKKYSTLLQNKNLQLSTIYNQCSEQKNRRSKLQKKLMQRQQMIQFLKCKYKQVQNNVNTIQNALKKEKKQRENLEVQFDRFRKQKESIKKEVMQVLNVVRAELYQTM